MRWSASEDETVKALYPDRKAIRKALPLRSHWAVRSRAQILGLAPKRHVWTGAQLKLLKRLYPSASKRELLAAFPWATYIGICATANHYGLVRNRALPTSSGYKVIDQIRGRAALVGYTMVQFDALAGTGVFFSKAKWSRGEEFKPEIGKAVSALGGTLRIDWGE